MTALATGVQRPETTDPMLNTGPQKGSTVVYQGALVMVDASGFIRPAAPSVAGSFCVGVAIARDFDIDRYDATGLADGTLYVRYVEGPVGLQNDGGSPILSTTPPGTPVYAVDDQTVSLSSNNGARPYAGRLKRLDSTVIGGPVIVDVSHIIGAHLYALSNVFPEGVGAALASAATIAPTQPIHHVTGTVAVATITPPPGFGGNGGQIILIPDALFTTTTAGNIALATTAVVNKALIMTYDPATAKWYPSY